VSVEYLTLEDLLIFVDDLGGLTVRDMGLLDSAVHRPRSSLFGRDAYESIHEKAAALLESIVRNHPLVDGNKRLGWVAAYVFYGLNGLILEAPDDDAYDLIIAIASGRLDFRAAADALNQWVVEDEEQK
jgi:death on curing protein